MMVKEHVTEVVAVDNYALRLSEMPRRPKKSKKGKSGTSQKRTSGAGENIAYYFLAVIGLIIIALVVAGILGYLKVL